MKLYKWQEEEGVEQILKLFKTNNHVCLAWYTGAGKTNVLAELCKRILDKDPKARIGISAYLTTEIRDQVTERLAEFGLKDKVHTVLAGTPKFVSHKPITVFLPQGLYKKPPKEKFDYLILDEAHSGIDDICIMLPTIIKKCTTKKTRVLLVSATPWDVLDKKEWKNCPVLKRPLDQGLRDGLITDFKFHAEEANVEFNADDFSRIGDLRSNAIVRQMAVLKSACIGKMENIISKYGTVMGNKVLVICPPGNYSEIARELAKRFNGKAFVMTHGSQRSGKIAELVSTEFNLNAFKNDPAVRFLFVTNKCQVGFDFQEMTSVIDLTMSRNIRVLAQRMGRIARKDGEKRKHYFYVYDKSLIADKLEWLIATVIDFCIGAYDGWTTKKAKYRPQELKVLTFTHPITITISEIIRGLRKDEAIENKKTLKFVDYAPQKVRKFTLEIAKEEMKKYSSRTEMWQKYPALYKWFRLNAKSEMDKFFPFKNKLGKWNSETVEALMQKWTGKLSRTEFNNKFGGAEDWTHKNNRRDLIEKYFPTDLKPWNEERARGELNKIRVWSEVRTKGGLRGWMQANGGEKKWQREWMKLVPGVSVRPTGRPKNKKGAVNAISKKRVS